MGGVLLHPRLRLLRAGPRGSVSNVPARLDAARRVPGQPARDVVRELGRDGRSGHPSGLEGVEEGQVEARLVEATDARVEAREDPLGLPLDPRIVGIGREEDRRLMEREGGFGVARPRPREPRQKRGGACARPRPPVARKACNRSELVPQSPLFMSSLTSVTSLPAEPRTTMRT